MVTEPALMPKDLAEWVEMSESAVSRQLRSLRIMHLVSYRKRNHNIFYCPKDHHILNLYREVSEHLEEPEDDSEHRDNLES